MTKLKVTVNTEEKIITREEDKIDKIITIVNSMTTKENSTTAKMITGKEIDQNTTITRTIKISHINNVNISLKDRMKKVSIKKIESMKEKILKELMTQENHKNSIRIVANMHLKTSRVSSLTWIQVIRRYNKKWKIKPKLSKSKSKSHPKIDLE